MTSARAICAERGVQFTPVRQRSLEILLETHAAMGAYDVLERLSAEGLGSKPPVAYRALSFLVDQGFHILARLEDLRPAVDGELVGAEDNLMVLDDDLDVGRAVRVDAGFDGQVVIDVVVVETCAQPHQAEDAEQAEEGQLPG